MMKQAEQMKRKKTNTGLILIFILILLLVVAGVGVQFLAGSKTIPVDYLDTSYSINVTDPRALMGDADYCIVARVDKLLDTDYRWPSDLEGKTVTSPYTQYEVTIVQSIKGELPEGTALDLYKAGGIAEDGSRYYLYEDDYLPAVGSTAVFFLYAQAADGSLLASGQGSTRPYSSDTARQVTAIAGEIPAGLNDEQLSDALTNQIVTDRERFVASPG
ncbi:MAG: hypothetical protein PHR21_00375 [Oscillospiraceae bacterium]|nr:hypothetical protein [Oscillospiraceae bacterium]MDD4368964.1 hypothetical protein [Oscillospiraceae bacterium]